VCVADEQREAVHERGVAGVGDAGVGEVGSGVLVQVHHLVEFIG